MLQQKGVVMKFRVLCMLFGVIIFSACGSGGGGGPSPPSYSETCQTAWSYYESGDYSSAVSEFLEAGDMESGDAEYRIGLGWSYIRLDDLTAAETQLDFAAGLLIEDDLRVNIGLASIAIMENDAAAVVTLLSGHVTGTDGWVHDHDPEIDAVDLHNLLAEAYIISGNIGDQSTSAVNALDAWGQLKKSLELDSSDSKADELYALLGGD